MIPGAFPEKITSDNGFTYKAVVQCDIPLAKVLF